MIKLIHTSDWHLGQNLYGYDRQQEQEDYLRQLAEIVREEQPDALLVSGDIYNNAAPSNGAEAMYVKGMLDIHKACPAMQMVVIAGNHDSASRLASTGPLWQLAGVRVVGAIARDKQGKALLDNHIIHLSTADGKGAIVVAVPYAYSYPMVGDQVLPEDRQATYFQSLLDYAQAQNAGDVPIILVAHVAVVGSDFTGHDCISDSQPLSVLGNGYDYAALGHIHRPQHPAGNQHVRYCGTPIAVSFDEQCEHSVSVVTIDQHGSEPHIVTRKIKNLRPLHTVPASGALPLDEALEQLRQQIAHEHNAYYRLRVLVDNYLPADATDRAKRVLADTDNRLCTIQPVVRKQELQSSANSRITQQDLQQLSPLEVAKMFFQDSGTAMTDCQQEMFNQVYTEILKEQRDEA